MISRYRSKPLPLRKLDAAIPRLPAHFPRLNKMIVDARTRQHGYNGERQVDYFLNNLSSKYEILHDINLHVDSKNFQIDSLIITPPGIFTIESKNYTGTITFNTYLEQLTRDNGQIESGFEYPMTQLRNQISNLENWLYQQNLMGIPVFGYVVIADPSTIIKVEGNQEAVGNIVKHSASIHHVIKDKVEQLKSNDTSKLQTNQIARTILRACSEFDINIMKAYGIKKEDILPGVICPDCGQLGMLRIYNGWICKGCRHFSKNAHEAALEDYFLLIGNAIRNQDCRRFLCLPTKDTATRILQQSGLIYNKKHRSWHKKAKQLHKN